MKWKFGDDVDRVYEPLSTHTHNCKIQTLAKLKAYKFNVYAKYQNLENVPKEDLE